MVTCFRRLSSKVSGSDVLHWPWIVTASMRTVTDMPASAAVAGHSFLEQR